MTEPLPFELSELEDTVIDRLRRVADHRPEAPALQGDGDHLSFAEFIELVDGLARWLFAELGPGDEPVAFLTGHAPVTLVAELAAICCGRAAMPLDPSLPPAHLAAQLEDAAPAAIIHNQANKLLVPDSTRRSYCWNRVADLPRTIGPLPEIGPDDRTFLLYTSGSTGPSKGVVLTHRAFLAGSRDLALAGAYLPGDRVANLAPLAFGAGVATTVWSLCAGAHMHLFPLRDRGLSAAAEWMRAEDITAFSAVTTVGRALAGTVADDPLPHVRSMVIGGETVQASDVAALRSIGAQPPRIFTVYASTELMLMAWNVIEPEIDPVDLGPPPIGRLVHGFDLELVALREDQQGSEEVGEIVIIAPPASEGYLGQPELSAERFAPAPDGVRVRYRTGDLGRRQDGDVTLVGRADRMVKVRGSRVELTLVEDALRTAPGVATAAVTTSPLENGDLALIGHVSSADPADPADPQRVRGHLRRNLPAQMVPLRVVVHDRLPALPNGKVDLAALSQFRTAPTSKGIAPRTELERRILKQLLAVTDLEILGVTDDLFEVGVDSLTAIEVLVRLEEEFGLRLPPSAWIDLATIEDLAAYIESGGGPYDAATTVVELQAGAVGRPALLIANDLHGRALRLRHLAEALGSDQPVFATDSPLLAGTHDLPRTMREIASLHVDDLLARQPSGPHHLLGYSWGTMLTVEIAQELAQRGQEVGFIGLIDFGPVHLRHRTRGKMVPRPPTGWSERAPSDLPLMDRVAYHLRRLREEPAGRRLRYASRVLDLSRQHDKAVTWIDLRRHGQVRADLRANHAWYRMVDLAHDYPFPPLDLDITLFVSDQTRKGRITKSPRLDYASATDPTLGWNRVVRGRLEVRDIRGHHNDLVEPPYVEDVGSIVRAAFDDWLDRDRP